MLSILGLIAIFIAAYYIYKTAKDTNRNAVGWAFLTVVTGIGLQIVLPAFIVLVIAIAMTISGKRLNDVDELLLQFPLALLLSRERFDANDAAHFLKTIQNLFRGEELLALTAIFAEPSVSSSRGVVIRVTLELCINVFLDVV